MKTSPTEQDLLKAINQCDPCGATALYDQYAGTLFKIIYCSVKDPKMAIAILEETLLYICNNCDDCLHQDKRLLLWMAGIAKHLAQKKVKAIDALF